MIMQLKIRIVAFALADVFQRITKHFMLALLIPTVVLAQGTLQISFDGPPLQPAGSAYLVTEYHESGMVFVPISGSQGFSRVWSNPTPTRPNNGTPYIQALVGDSFKFIRQDGSLFSVSAMDVAGYSTVAAEFSVDYYGYRPDGSTVSTNFSGNGIDFRTVYFGQEWSGLSHVEIPTWGWSLDNLFVGGIPEPSVATMLVSGTVTLWFFSRKGRKQLCVSHTQQPQQP